MRWREGAAGRDENRRSAPLVCVACPAKQLPYDTKIMRSEGY